MAPLKTKHLLRIACVAFVWLLLPAVAHAQSWYNGSWSYRKAITVDFTKVGSTQTNFPVLINLSSDANLAAHALSSGNDILFTSSDGVTKLNHEIELYTSATGALIAWVQVPSLSSSANTVLYLYYGNSGATNQQNATAVWDSNYSAVWHLPNGSSLSLSDSTSNARTGTNHSATATTGQIDGGASFSGSTQYVTVPSATLPSSNNFTVSLWFKATFGHNGALFDEQNASIGSTPTSWDPMLYIDTNGKLDGGIYNGAATPIVSASTVNNGAWHYAVLTVNTSSTIQTLYLDGSQVGTLSGTPEGPFTTVAIGAGYTNSWPNPPSSGKSYFNGQIDDVRVSSSATARSGNWISTEWNNQNSPSTFYSLGSETTSPKTWDGGAGTNNWGDAANWSPDGVPTSSNDVSLTGANTININVAAVANNLTLNNAALTLTVNSGQSLTVSGSLTLTSGTLNTQAAFPTVSGTVNVAGGTVGFTGSVDQTVPAYTYNNLTINKASGTATLAAATTLSGDLTLTQGTLSAGASNFNLTVIGNWTNNGGTYSGGSSTVTLTGATGTIGGTASTAFPTLSIDGGSAYTMNNSNTATSLTLLAGGTATSLTQASGTSLTVSGNVTINQPTATLTEAWNINAATATVGGTLTIGGTNTTAGRVAQVAITTGSLTVTGATSYAANSVAANQVITVSTGTITLNSALTLSSGTLSITSTGTIDFKNNITFGGANNPSFSTVAGSNIIFEGNYTGTSTALLLNGSSNTTFAGNSTITPPASPNYIGFGNVTLNSGSTVTLASGAGLLFYVGGNWTNNGGTLSASSSTNLTFYGTGKTIGGTSSTTFPIIEIYSGTNTTYTMNNSNSATGLLFDGGTLATSLTLGSSSVALTINGTVTMNQPTAAVTENWNINAGTATVSGLITFAGAVATASEISKIMITTGTLNANGGLTFVASLAADKVIDMSGGAGTLNLKGALTVPAASSTLTAGTSGSIFNYADSAAQTVNFFTTGAYNNLHTNNTSASGATLSAAITAANVTGNLRVQSGTFNNGSFAIAGNAAKTFEVVNGATFKVAGTTSAFPTGFGTVTLGATSTVDYSGTGAQTVAAQNYGNLTISAARAANNVTLVNSGTIGVAGTLSDTATFTAGNGLVTTTSTVAYNGTSSQTVTPLSPIVSGSSMYNNLTINNASGATLGGNVTVGGTLTFTSGNITTASNAIYINSTGSVSRTSGHVVGNFKKNVTTGATNRTFEIGDANNYTPVTVAFASVTSAGDLTASTTTGDHPNISSSSIDPAKTANRYWTLTNSGIVFTNFNVTLNFVSGDLDSGANTGNFIVGKFSSSTWTYPTVGTKTATSTQATGVTAFGDFQLGEGSTTATWTGTVSNLWSNGSNWSGLGGSAPTAGNDLIFPSGASNLSTSNDITAGTSFNSITISGSGYTLTGNSIALAAGNLSDTNASGSNTISLAISMSATRTFSVNNAGETLTVSGVISGAGGLIKNGGSGTLILSGANTYSGTTTINVGTLSVAADNNLGTAPGSATAGQLTFAGGTLATTATFTLSSNRGIAFTSTGTIDVASSMTLTYGGIAAGTGGLIKTSAGTLTLSANNTYNGTTTVSAGTLLVNGSQSSSAVSVNGGTLGGTGTVGAVSSTSAGGTISPGSGPGILNTGNVNWSSGSPSFSVEVNGTTVGSGYDQLNVTGTINLTGATLSGTTGFTPARGATFTIIKNNTGGTITGTFSGLAEGAGVSLGGQSFTISYVGGAGHDVVLTASGPNVTLGNSVNPSGSQPPATDLAYTVTFTNTQCCGAQSLVITDPIPANTDFKVGSVTNSLGTTGLTVVAAYSNDSGTTWTYTPVSGGGGADAGYDRAVTNIRWTFTGNLSQTSPNNSGSVSFTAKIR